MKKIIIVLLLCSATPALLSAQNNVPQRNITVTGMSEIEIVPDEIYVAVSLREFTRDKKKYTIEELESAFLNFVEKTASTPRTDVKMDNTDARIIALKRKEKDAIIEKSYEVKFKNTGQVMLLFAASDSLNLSSVWITRYWHSKMDSYKQEVRVNAMKDSQNKAGYMLGAIGQSAGTVQTVRELYPAVSIDDGISNGSYYNYRNGGYKRSYDDSFGTVGGAFNIIETDKSPIVKTIKLRYQVEVTYLIAG